VVERSTLHLQYRVADKSLARQGRKQANVFLILSFRRVQYVICFIVCVECV
jgi:hypothetical protein